jgi:hypothetical protein
MKYIIYIIHMFKIVKDNHIYPRKKSCHIIQFILLWMHNYIESSLAQFN